MSFDRVLIIGRKPFGSPARSSNAAEAAVRMRGRAGPRVGVFLEAAVVGLAAWGIGVACALPVTPRALLPLFFATLFPPQVASNLGPSLSAILIYVLMAGVLFFRPQGLFPARG